MEPIEVFQILGIEQTKDERALKNAYRDKLTVTNPEDDPEGFKRLRMAYEEACRYAGTPDAEENEEAEPTLEDDTPAGQWVRGVRKVYENITDRCDVEKWKALFEADDFLCVKAHGHLAAVAASRPNHGFPVFQGGFFTQQDGREVYLNGGRKAVFLHAARDRRHKSGEGWRG